MGSRSPTIVRFGAVALAIACAALPRTSRASAAPVSSAPGAWLRPVAGAVARPFVEPVSRYGAGHRGADLVAPTGTPVRAANAGEVSFAGSVAGSLHVVVAHEGGLRTSYSFLAAIAVRRGARITRGTVVGTAGGTTGDHTGVLHLGLRIGDRYVDPMALFSPTDLTRLIRLVPVDEPEQGGIDPPALESRSLAESLHLPRGLPGLEPEPQGDVLDAAGNALGAIAATAGRLAEPVRAPIEVLGGVAAKLWRRSAAATLVADARTISDRLVGWARTRLDCVRDTAPPPGGGGSGHRVLAVAGINSSTDGETGATLALDADRLGYDPSEVRYFSYAPDGGPYGPEATTGALGTAALRLGEQLRALQREEPGREVDLIGHSQGGVVIAKFLRDVYDPGDPTLPPIGTVVTMASPLQGAPVATAVRRVRETETGRRALDGLDRRAAGALPSTAAIATAQLAEGSPLIRGLAAAPLPEQIDLTAIGAVDDVMAPADHAALAGHPSVTVNPAGSSDHSSVVDDPAALEAVRLALERRGPPCVGVVDGVRGAVEPVLISRAEHTTGELVRAAGGAADLLLGKDRRKAPTQPRSGARPPEIFGKDRWRAPTQPRSGGRPPEIFGKDRWRAPTQPRSGGRPPEIFGKDAR